MATGERQPDDVGLVSDLIDFALCALLALISLAAMTWFWADLIAFGSDIGWSATLRAALAALGMRLTSWH